MVWMFNECHKLKEIKGINKFNTNKVTNMRTMFQKCYELEYLDLSNFNTENVTDMKWMFTNCYKLKEIKGIYNFRISNIIYFYETFDECNDLEYINTSKFNTFNSQLISKILNREIIKNE